MKRLFAKIKRSVRTFRVLKRKTDPTTPFDNPWQASHMAESALEPRSAESVTDAKEHTAKQTCCGSGLESLPPEVRRHLLSTLDLARLKALVRASPTFHEQYLLDRKYLLCRSLEETWGSVTVDAYAVHQSTAQAGDVKQNITEFLRWYSEQTSQRCLLLPDNLTLDEVLDMVAFYLHHVKPITEYFARWALDDLTDQAGNEPHDRKQALQLTRAESMRLTRAAYRLQLLGQLVHRGNWEKGPSKLEITLMFLNVLEPWEVEELVSFYQWAYGVYDKILDDIYWDLHPDNPKSNDQGRPPTPDGAFDFDNSFLFETKSHEHLVSTMQKHITSSYIPFNPIEGVLGDRQQAVRRAQHPSERDRMQEQRAPFPFRGDGGPDAPPLAWTTLWGDTYSNLYGLKIPEDLRRWGYVFWDAARFEASGGREVLKRQWEKYWVDYWGEYDPRDDIY